ncbi:hypothetical protein BD310DRAFT_921527 [Dichomitus squalens]|uniref:DUF6533 domain-containing protein n=1 Tax=Dichomitus squalens TaxID=114155 RepID=A0A4Q9Q1Q0_9APHY|nr:hypothetical protein BD310DRAFT_921527 [Dichomitus squalens]
MSGHFVPEPVYIHNYLHLVGVAILYYDFLLTFGDEYWRIWKNRKTVASGLFFLNRYLPVFADMVVNWGNFHEFPTEAGCRHYAFFRQVLLIVNQVVVCYILFLRTFALYGRSWRVGGSVLGFSFSLLGISVWAVIGQHEDVELRGGCHTAADRITAIRTAVAWESLFLFDCTIFSLTLFKTLMERRRNPVASGKRDIVSLVMRDGTLYFAVMASANLANTLTFYFLEPLLRGCLSTAASSISVTMMSRLMLNLHSSAFARNELVTTRTGDTASSSSNSTTLMFTSRISMPHLLSTGWDPEGSRLHRESAYVRDLHSARDGGYIEEVYELADYRGGREDESGHLRVPLQGRRGAEIGKPIVGRREYHD